MGAPPVDLIARKQMERQIHRSVKHCNLLRDLLSLSKAVSDMTGTGSKHQE